MTKTVLWTLICLNVEHRILFYLFKNERDFFYHNIDFINIYIYKDVTAEPVGLNFSRYSMDKRPLKYKRWYSKNVQKI